MSKKQDKDLKQIQKIEAAFLSQIGYEHSKQLLEEHDKHAEEIAALEYPEELDIWFEDFIQTQQRKSKWQTLANIGEFLRKRAAVLILITIFSTACLALNVEAVRVKVLNTLIEINERYSEVKVVEGDPAGSADYLDQIPASWGSFYYPAFIPEGFDFDSTLGSGRLKILTFVNALNEEIVFMQSEINTDFLLDTEGSTTTKVDINGNVGLLIEENEKLILFWYNQEFSFCLESHTDKSTIIKIAQSVLKKNK